MSARRRVRYTKRRYAFRLRVSGELLVLSGAVNEILELSVTAFIDEDINRAYRVEPLEERIDVLCDEMKLRHVDRLQTGDCSLQTGFVFTDLLTNFERVADHCSNLAIAMIELRDDAYDTHDYVINLKGDACAQFRRASTAITRRNTKYETKPEVLLCTSGFCTYCGK